MTFSPFISSLGMILKFALMGLIALKPLILIGGGAHAKVALENALLNDIAVAGILDSRLAIGTAVLDTKVVGADDWLAHPETAYHCFHLAITDPIIRARIHADLIRRDLEIISLIHPRAYVSRKSTIGDGCFVAVGAIVNIATICGIGVVVNTGAQIDHDCTIGANAHIAPGAVIAGGVQVGERVFIGSGAVVTPNCRIGNGAVVGAGAVVIGDVPENGRVFGVPARAKG